MTKISPSPQSGISSPRSGRWLVLAAAVMWSTAGFFAKAPLFESWPIEDRGLLLGFWRAFFASLVLIPLVRKPRWTPGLVPLVLIFAAMNYVYMSAITRTSAANAIWLQNTAPAWVLILGVWLFGEKANRRDWWFLPFAMSGVGLILFFESQGNQGDGIVFGLLSGITYAGVILFVRLLRHENQAWLIALCHIVTVLVFLPFVVQRNIWPEGRQYMVLAGFGVFQLGLPYLIFAKGVSRIPGHEAAAIALLEPILVPVWVFLAWRNNPAYHLPHWWTFVGACLILVGLLLRFRRPSRKDEKPGSKTKDRDKHAEAPERVSPTT